MPLMDRPPHVVTVYPATTTTDVATGLPVNVPGDPNGTGVEVHGWVQRPSQTAQTTDGYWTGETWQFLGRSFPGGARSVVRWDGFLFDVTEPPQRRQGGSANMTHVVVRLVARTPGGALS